MIRRNQAGIGDLGIGPVGRLIDTRADAIAGMWRISWELELLDGIDTAMTAVHVFHDGAHVASVTGEQEFWFAPPTDSSSDQLELFLCPAGGLWVDGCDAWRPRDRVDLSWELSGAAYTVRVRGNAGNTLTADPPIAILTRHSASVPGAMVRQMEASGEWGGAPGYHEIDITITSGGMVDYAAYTWAWGDVVGGGVCRSWPDEVINGVRIWFDASTVYEVNDTWTVRVGLPEDYTTAKTTESGDRTFRIDTDTLAGNITTGADTVTVLLAPPPIRPEYYSQTAYTPGSGVISITWTYMDDDPASWRVYQNRPWTNESDTHWIPTQRGDLFSGGRFQGVSLQLWPGYNRITATTLDAIGQESGESPPTEIYLDDALNIVTLPNPPIGIDAEQVANGDIVVTVWVDDTVTGIKIYHDAHDGSVDYGTVIQSVAVTPTGSVTAVIVTLSAGLTDGDYIIAARSVNGVNVEDNTDVVVLITRDTSASAQATSLVAEVVQ